MNSQSYLVHPVSAAALQRFVQRPSHAVLLSGAQGIGKTQLAVELAAALLHIAGDKMADYQYFRRVRPVKDSLTIEQIRDLIGFFRLKVPGQQIIDRVAVIEDAELMGREAQNALLKLLEEPPQGSVLILTSSKRERLLPTIRSRLQAIFIQTPESSAITEYFASQGYDRAAISKANLLAGGNMAELQHQLADEPTEASMLTTVKQALQADRFTRLILVEGPLKPKDQAVLFVATLLRVADVSAEAAAAKHADTFDRWSGVLRAAHTAELALQQNGNPKLVLTDLLLSL